MPEITELMPLLIAGAVFFVILFISNLKKAKA
jgi:hypothetical protein